MEEHNWKLPLVDGCLDLVFILYVHFPGAICASDLLLQALFSRSMMMLIIFCAITCRR